DDVVGYPHSQVRLSCVQCFRGAARLDDCCFLFLCSRCVVACSCDHLVCLFVCLIVLSLVLSFPSPVIRPCSEILTLVRKGFPPAHPVQPGEVLPLANQASAVIQQV